MKIEINSIDKLEDFASLFAKEIKIGEVYLLSGDLGSGKTTFVKSVNRFLNGDDIANSPTFSLVNIYEGKVIINHLDLYRLEDETEIESFEYEDYFYPSNSVTFIEWPEMAKSYLPRRVYKLNFTYDVNGRFLEIDDKLVGKLGL